MMETKRSGMFSTDFAAVTAAMLFVFFGSVACGGQGHVIFSQPTSQTSASESM